MTESTISAEEAIRLLDVKKATLYTYVSRGLVRTLPDPTDPRRRRYLASDVERLCNRHRARAGHTAVAADALRWGEPVIDSAISLIEAGKLYYRGMNALLLCERMRFEAAADFLWTSRTDADSVWPVSAGHLNAGLAGLDTATPLERMSIMCPRLAVADPLRFGAPDSAEHARARVLMRDMAAVGTGRDLPGSVADVLAGGDADVAAVLDAALILCAEHGLNASTFAVRVAASAGADLYACIAAGLATLSGPRHGGMCLQVERLFEEVSTDNARRVLGRRLADGQLVPGFGHPLYPKGDPRARRLLDLARGAGDCAVANDICETMAGAGHPAPSLDLGLVAVTHGLRLAPGTSQAVFALGRMAGWVAHALEQRQQQFLLRPRARYVGTPPSPGEES